MEEEEESSPERQIRSRGQSISSYFDTTEQKEKNMSIQTLGGADLTSLKKKKKSQNVAVKKIKLKHKR